MSNNVDRNIPFIEKEIKKTIMNTTTYVLVSSTEVSKRDMESDVEKAFQMFRDFEAKFSRFKQDSLLSRFNRGEIDVVDCDFDRMVKIAIQQNKKTINR